MREMPELRLTNLDLLTYAGNPANVSDVAGDPRYRFVHGDIADHAAVDEAIGDGVDAIVNFAAESHVDRSILEPEAFLRTDIIGTHVLLEAARRHGVSRFLQVSTDEVYGHVKEGASREDANIAPRSPYAASKAGGDLQVLAYHTTYGLQTLITRGSNTYGPCQFPEKLIPLFVTNLINDQPVPLYGDGLQVRDWLHVEDHAAGILHVLRSGTPGEIYNVGGGNPRVNREITERLIEYTGRRFETHVRHVEDRPGHDRRYALDCAKVHALGWRPQVDFEEGLRSTVRWYQENERWWKPLKSGEFVQYYDKQYAKREVYTP
jgi:dTDP-glucose 4,6-dehydratase